MTEAGLFLALGCALLANVAMLCKHRGAVSAPEVRFRRPLASAASLFASSWWTVGFVIAFIAWGLHIAAMSMAPLSLVQAVIAGGIALLAIPARHLFGISLGWKEMAGLGLSAAGLAFLALTATDHPPGAGTEYSAQTMAMFEGVAITLGIALLLSGARGGGHRHGGLMLAIAAGLLIGVSNVALKALAETVPGDLAAIISPWALVAAAGGFGAFFALARSLQLGDPVTVIVISSVAANCAAIAGGVLVYGDPIGSDALGVAARSAAFAAVIAAAALIPAAPQRSAQAA
jgi:multidrug transporter EmrE-like cation transporter